MLVLVFFFRYSKIYKVRTFKPNAKPVFFPRLITGLNPDHLALRVIVKGVYLTKLAHLDISAPPTHLFSALRAPVEVIMPLKQHAAATAAARIVTI